MIGTTFAGCRSRDGRHHLGELTFVLLATVWLAGCGSEAALPTSTPSLTTPATPVSSSPAPTPSPSVAANVACRPSSAPADPLTGFGATFPAWSAHHQADPRHPDFFLPYLNDGLDRYTLVLCTRDGRVSAYHLNFTPLITLSESKRAFRSELPPDAVLVSDTVQSGCEHIQYRSAALARALGVDDPDGVADAAIILPDNPQQQAAVGTIFIDARVRLKEVPQVC